MKNKLFPTIGYLVIIITFFIIFSISFGFLQTSLPASWLVWGKRLSYVILALLIIWQIRRVYNKKGTKNKLFPTIGNFVVILLFFIIFSIPFSLLQTSLPKSWMAWGMLLGYFNYLGNPSAV